MSGKLLSLSGLYAITDSGLMPGDQLFVKTEAVLREGCRLLQYRDKEAEAEQKLQRALHLKSLCHRYGSLFVVNDDLELALQSGADGLHVGQTDIPLPDIRARVGDDFIVGVSCHGDVGLAKEAQQQGASYVALGRFFSSHTKPNAPHATLEALQQARQELSIPIVAIGGITRDNAPLVLERGAQMIAVIHDLFAADDVEGAEGVSARAQEFLQYFSAD